MALLTRDFLTDLGIQLDDANYQALAEHFETTLHERVIAEIVEEFTPEQAEELANLKGGDEATVQQWLTENVADLPEIVADEVDILLGEIAENSEAI